MPKLIHRKDFNRTVAILKNSAPEGRETLALAGTIESLAFLSGRLERRYANACNHEWACTPAYEKGTARLEEQARKAAADAGLQIYLQGDPRGVCVHVSWEPIADDNYNRSGVYLMHFSGKDY